MTQDPLDERRRLFLARQQARQAALVQPIPAPPLPAPSPSRRRVQFVVRAAIVGMLLGMGLIAFHSVTFDLPTSIVDALLPRF